MKAGAATGIKESIAVGEEGRLCSVTSGKARRFDSTREAIDYLAKLKVSGDYQFEVVACKAAPEAEAGELSRPAY